MGAYLLTNPAQQYFPGASVAQNTFTAAKDIPVGENTTEFAAFDAGSLKPGAGFTWQGWGIASNTGTPTVILGLYYGGVAGTALAVSTAKTTTTAMSNWEWHAEFIGRVLNVGSTGLTFIGSGFWKLPTSLTAWTEIRWPETAPTTVGSLDSTVRKIVTLGWTWSASSVSNTVTCHDSRLRIDG